MLLDGYGGDPVHRAVILLENNRIVAAGAASLWVGDWVRHGEIHDR
jgi:hypothetical protein